MAYLLHQCPFMDSKKTSNLLLILIINFVSLLAFSSGPGDGAGGGNVVRCLSPQNSSAFDWTIIDRFSIPLIQSAWNIGLTPTSKEQNAQSQVANSQEEKITANDKDQKIQILDRSKLSGILSLSKNILNQWKLSTCEQISSETFYLISIIEQKLDSLIFYDSPNRLTLQNKFVLPDNMDKYCEGSMEMETALLYFYKYGVIISGPLWDHLTDTVKAELLIKESVRELQLGSLIYEDNMEVQKLVANLIEGPKLNNNLVKHLSSSLLKNVKAMVPILENIGGISCAQNSGWTLNKENPSFDYLMTVFSTDPVLSLKRSGNTSIEPEEIFDDLNNKGYIVP